MNWYDWLWLIVAGVLVIGYLVFAIIWYVRGNRLEKKAKIGKGKTTRKKK
jgi:type VI protein secretion system component VasK